MASQLRPAARLVRWWPRLRRWHQGVLIGYMLMAVLSLGIVIGPYMNDRAISANSERALATVTSVGNLRTMVEYQDADGYYRAPSTGVLYPSDLREGQRVWVEYSREDPSLVKVEGREWTLSIIPALSVWLSSSLIAIMLWAIPDIRTYQRNQQKREQQGVQDGAATGIAPVTSTAPSEKHRSIADHPDLDVQAEDF